MSFWFCGLAPFLVGTALFLTCGWLSRDSLENNHVVMTFLLLAVIPAIEGSLPSAETCLP